MENPSNLISKVHRFQETSALHFNNKMTFEQKVRSNDFQGFTMGDFMSLPLIIYPTFVKIGNH